MTPSIIAIRVIPRAAVSKVDGMRGDAWLVRLRTPPVDGAANAELIEVLASTLRIPKRDISIVAGERSRLKRVSIGGLDAATIAARLAM
jgi:uncharacterized protein (TIGR00251 family)